MKEFKLRIDEPKLLSEDIAASIKDAIIRGRFQPGEKIAEGELAESMGISRTPLREAFRKLQNEGFITIIPRKGAVVATLDPREASELYEIKSYLEGLAARMAVPRMKEKEVERLEKLEAELRQATGANDVEGFYRTHTRFHEVFIRNCGNDRLIQMIANLNDHFKRYGIVSLTQPGRYDRTHQQHQGIIEAFRQGNPDLAEARVRENVLTGGKVLIERLAARESGQAREEV
jgi:DNA-binding GntR family transcriptional regulator